MVKVRLYQPGEWLRMQCSHCAAQLEGFNEPSRSSKFACPACAKENELDPNAAPPAAATTATATAAKDTTYYEILEVSPTATQQEIKKAFHKRAARLHPDKTGGTTNAQFLELQEAYGILSNEDSRAHYDRHGRNKGGADDVSDIQARFGGLFGGTTGRFDELLGEIAIISEMGSAIRKGEEEAVDGVPAKPTTDAEEKAKEAKRAKRIETLARNLARRLDTFDPAKPEPFKASINELCEDLRAESFGVELLHVIGQVYGLNATSCKYSPAAQGWTGTWVSSLKMKSLYITSTVSTLRKAWHVKSAFAKLEKTPAGEGSDAAATHKAGLEEQAAKAAIEAIWEGVRAEVISVVSEVTQVVLSPDPEAPRTEKQEIERLVTDAERSQLQRRSIALELMGRMFEQVKRDEGQQDIFEMLAQQQQSQAQAAQA
jgi:hypothetical protein